MDATYSEGRRLNGQSFARRKPPIGWVYTIAAGVSLAAWVGLFAAGSWVASAMFG